MSDMKQLQRELGVDNPLEVIVVIFALMLGAVWVLTHLPEIWLAIVGWLVTNHILVAATANPIVTIPGGAGAGLDPLRLGITIGLICIISSPFIALTVALRRRRREREE